MFWSLQPFLQYKHYVICLFIWYIDKMLAFSNFKMHPRFKKRKTFGSITQYSSTSLQLVNCLGKKQWKFLDNHVGQDQSQLEPPGANFKFQNLSSDLADTRKKRDLTCEKRMKKFTALVIRIWFLSPRRRCHH